MYGTSVLLDLEEVGLLPGFAVACCCRICIRTCPSSCIAVCSSSIYPDTALEEAQEGVEGNTVACLRARPAC